jgi:hypothetical protein
VNGFSAFVIVATVLSVAAAAQNVDRIPRTPDGRPDLQGFWTNGTITPLLRPLEFANSAMERQWRGSSGRMHVVEQFSRTDIRKGITTLGNILRGARVEDGPR